MKQTYRKSWAGNLLMWSDLTLDPSFKVKRWFTGFSELSLQWIQICIGSPMRRFSFQQWKLLCENLKVEKSLISINLGNLLIENPT